MGTNQMRTCAIAAGLATAGAFAFSAPARAVESPSTTHEVTCAGFLFNADFSVFLAASTTFAMPFGVSGPDRAAPGETIQLEMLPLPFALPDSIVVEDSAGVVAPAEYEVDGFTGQSVTWNAATTGVTVTGAAVGGGSGATSADPQFLGNVLALSLGGDFDPAVPWTLPTATYTATVTAPDGGTVTVAPAEPFITFGRFDLSLGGEDFSLNQATCSAVAPAAATIQIPVFVDVTAPTVTINSPADGATFAQGQPVLADYACSDTQSGVATCDGQVATGAAIDTATPGQHSFAVRAIDVDGNLTTTTVSYTVEATPPPPAPSGFEPMIPARLLDTRPGTTTVDNTFAGGGLTQPGSTIELQVAGRAGIPTDATAAALNITATDTQAAGGYITVYPCGTTPPNASTLNYYAPSQTVANEIVAKLGTGGKVCITTNIAATHLITDATGWFSPDTNP